MTRRTRVLRGVLLGVAIALPVWADAPIDGPNKQYEDFTSEDKEITDHFTRLVWERPGVPYPAKMALSDAVAFCANGTRRLPSLKELLTLVDEEPHLEYDGTSDTPRMIDQPAFSNTPPEDFWTSSVLRGQNATVDFADGTVHYADVTDPRRVRCVVSLP